MGLAWSGAKALLGFLPQSSTPLGFSAAPDSRILLFNFAVALVTGLMFGLVPAMQSTRPDIGRTLKDQAVRWPEPVTRVCASRLSPHR